MVVNCNKRTRRQGGGKLLQGATGSQSELPPAAVFKQPSETFVNAVRFIFMTATVIRRNASVPSLYGASSTLFCLYRRYKITPASNMAATEKAKERNGLCCTNSLNSGLKRSEDDRSPPISFGEFDRSPFNARNIMSKRARINADPLQHSYGNARSSTSTAGHSAAEEDGDGDKERPAASDSVTHESEIQDKIDNHVADSQPIEEIMEIRDGVETNGMDDEDDDCDDVSEISGLSDLGVEGRWSSSAGMIAWVHSEIAQGTDLRVVLGSLVPDGTEIPEDLDDRTLWQLIISIITEPPRRKKLKDVATLETVVQLIRSCKKIVVLTGAGVSVSCGIPDFRSRDGIYARLAVDYPDLPDPQAMFDIQYFKKNPRPFFKFAKEIYPGQFNPSLSHRFIGHLESSKQLLRNYTQNIDTLESAAGITRVVQCHGSFAGATCMICKHKVDAEAIRDDIMNQVIPRCPRCGAEEELAILKPDIVFFGESLSEEFHRQIELDKDECDLLIVIGSSLKVRPVAIIPNIISADVPQVLINREPLRHLSFDVELLGDCDVIVNELCHLLGDGFKSLCTTKERSAELKREELHLPGPSCPAANAQKPDDTLDVLRSPGPVVPKDEGCAGAEKTDGCTSTDGQNVAAADESTTAGDVDHHHKNAPLSIKLSSYLKENSYLYRPPRQYIFCGAEVYEEDDDSFGDTDSSSSSSAQEEDDSPKDQSIEYTQDDRLGESETTGMDHESSGDSKVAKTAATEEEEGQRG